MHEELIWKQAEIIRAITLTVFDGLTEEEADRIPQGFNNNIRWNLGHILIVQEQMVQQFDASADSGRFVQLPAAYLKMFGNRTKPADWTEAPPSLDVLKQLLQEQTGIVRERLHGRLAEKARKPFIRLGHAMETLGDIVAYSFFHEGIHNGAIAGLRKAIAAAAN